MPNSPLQDFSSNFGSPDGSVPDLERVGARSTNSIEERFEAILARKLSQIEASLGALASCRNFVARTISGNDYKQDLKC